MKHWVWITLLFILLFSLPSAQAQNHLAGILRDEYALALTPPLKSLGMGGAYVGVDGPQSMNPASLSSVDWMEGTLSYGFYDSEAGPSAHRARLDGILPAPYIGGGARLMLDGVASEGHEATYLNAPVGYDAFTLGLQYGRNLTDWLAIGMGAYPYEKANVDMFIPGGKVHGEALSQIGSIQFGTLVRPHERITLGMQAIYIKDDLEAWLPAGGGHMGDDFHIHYFAFGASAKPFDGTLVALDYWVGEINGRFAPGVPLNVDVDRWNLGVQQRVCDYFDVRLGSDNGGISTGFTIHIRENLDLDYAYVNKMLRDKQGIFGDTEYHGISMTYRFK